MRAKKVVLLVDNAKGCGFGHLARSKGMAQAFQAEGFTVRFICNERTSFLNGFEVAEEPTWQRLGGSIRRHLKDTGLTVVDSYLVDQRTVNAVAAHESTSVWFDDVYRADFKSGFIVNSALGASPSLYADSEARLLLGPQWQSFRREFWNRPNHRIRPLIEKIGIWISGAGFDDLAEVVVSRLRRIDSMDIVMLGEPRKGIRGCRFTGALDERGLVDWMGGLDVFLTGGGQSFLEALGLGVPTIALIVAENQRPNVEAWTRLGATKSMNSVDSFCSLDGIRDLMESYTYQERVKCSEIARERMNTDGALRIAQSLLQ